MPVDMPRQPRAPNASQVQSDIKALGVEEPLQQIDFTAALLGAAKAEGLHCCVETCGQAGLDQTAIQNAVIA